MFWYIILIILALILAGCLINAHLDLVKLRRALTITDAKREAAEKGNVEIEESYQMDLLSAQERVKSLALTVAYQDERIGELSKTVDDMSISFLQMYGEVERLDSIVSFG